MDITIEAYSDGWRVIVDDNEYHWDHNDEELGVPQIAKLLRDLGHTVEVNEVY